MDRDRDILGPWVFEIYRRGFAGSVWDRECRLVTFEVRTELGLLIASAPTMRDALERIVAIAPLGSASYEIALGAIEGLIEREGLALD